MKRRTRSELSVNRGFMDGYKSYDTSDGFGSRAQWKQAFHQRFTHDEAQEILETDNDDPYTILGIKTGATLQEIKTAFRTLIMKWHPDRNMDNIAEAESRSKKIIAAYSLLT